MRENGMLDVACSEPLRRKALGKLTGSAVTNRHGVPCLPHGGRGVNLRGWGRGVVTAASPFPCLAVLFQALPYRAWGGVCAHSPEFTCT